MVFTPESLNFSRYFSVKNKISLLYCAASDSGGMEVDKVACSLFPLLQVISANYIYGFGLGNVLYGFERELDSDDRVTR